jgi:hypothetical protein
LYIKELELYKEEVFTEEQQLEKQFLEFYETKYNKKLVINNEGDRYYKVV